VKRLGNQSKSVHYFCKITEVIKKCCFCFLIISLFCFNISANDKEKVSIIIPVYNVEKYIRECLDSVINQTYKNLEIICVDDCSPDKSAKIIEEYLQKDKRIKIIRHDKNQGTGVARNTGMKNSNGEYISFVDPDDYLNLNIIELMVKKQKETDVDIVVSNFRNFTREETPDLEDILESRNFLKCSSQERYQIGFNNFQDNLNSVFISACGKLYKKDFLIKNNIWFINQNIAGEDRGFCLKVLSNFPLVSFMSNVGINYRVNQNSSTMTSTFRKYIADLQTMLKDFFQYLDQQFEKDKAEKLKELTKASSNYKRFFTTSILRSLIYWVIIVAEFFMN